MPHKSKEQYRGLKPVKKDAPDFDERIAKLHAGRDESNARKKAQKEQRKQYQQQLTEIRSDGLDKAKTRMEAGEIQDPLEIVQDMIMNMMVTVNNPDADKTQAHKEKELLLKATSLYSDLLGSRPTTNLDADVEDEEELTPEQLTEQLNEATNNLRVVK